MKGPSKNLVDQHLVARLWPVIDRVHRVRLWTGLAIVWLVVACVALVCLLSNFSGHSYFPVRFLIPTLLGLGLFFSVGVWVWSRLTRCTESRAAYLVERKFAGLDARLITAIEQQPDPETGLYNALQYELLREVVYHSYQTPWNQAISSRSLNSAKLATTSAMVALAMILASYAWFAAPTPIDLTVIEFQQVASGNQQYEIQVDPGDVEVELGSSLMVLARFLEQLPPEAKLVYEFQETPQVQANSNEIPMRKSLADPVFGARINSVTGPLQYHVEFANQQSPTYRVSTFEYPKLVRADAELAYPQFTQLENRFLQDVRRITAVEGTEVKLTCLLNKPVAKAVLQSRDGESIDLVVSPEPNTWFTNIVLRESVNYDLHLTDADGRKNQTPITFRLNVLKNRAPEVKWIRPTSDIEASALEELFTSASVWDDIGIVRAGFAYSLVGQATKEVVLAENLPGNNRVNLEFIVALEELHVKPDDLVTFYYWVEDLIDDLVVRRTFSDLFFAEIRPFEEIFRQGQTPPGGQQPQRQNQPQAGEGSQNAQQAEQLTELQKQIINATWRVLRNETAASVSTRFSDDVRTIIESQGSAQDQLATLMEQLTDPASQGFTRRAMESMQTAIDALQQAMVSAETGHLNDALSAEQQAYQDLLKLRVRENEVARMEQSQMQNQRSQQNSRSRQQLQQLQLRQDDNPYQEERLAQPEANPEQQEDRQVLSRLRELARRQGDLNERIKELQSALDEAENESERQEIQRELKRLHEEQQQILRDTEELQERMNQAENQQRMSEENQRLEEARENIRRAAEALENNQLSQAAAEGTRAEQEIRELRDEFQQRTSSQFTQDVRNLREQARDLAEQQQQIGDRLQDLRNESRTTRSLSETDQRNQLVEDLARQQEDLERLREQMRDTVENAEGFEPLLAEQIYDTYRQSEHDRPGQSLRSAESLVRRGFDFEAEVDERRATEAIERIREGIEQAAERVLGNETEALRRANRELEQLTREIDNEWRRSAGQQQGDQTDDNSQDPATSQNSQSAPAQQGDPRNAENQTAETESQSPEPSRGAGEGMRRDDSNDNERASEDSRVPVNPEGDGAGRARNESDEEGNSGRTGERGRDNLDENQADAGEPGNRDRQPSLRSLGDNDSPRYGDATGLGADQRDPLERGEWRDDRDVRPLTGEN
ncbi:MAG TPA: hypothetical protein PKD64_17200, partial [Pirellulaceae bacterium]|nr:hypothetical protein [Pirellulaceae bacterium]